MQNNTSYNYLFKVVQMGDEGNNICQLQGVGKTCLLQQYVSNKFIEHYDPTIGVEFGAQLVPFKDLNIKLQIWDTAGQVSFRSITRSYYRGSAAILLVYSIDKRQSFDDVPVWLEELKLTLNPNQIVILVGNKSDLEDKREVTYEEGQTFAQNHGLHFYELSAKNHKSVEELFQHTIQLIHNHIIAGVIHPNVEYAGVKEGPQNKQNNEQNQEKTNETKEG
ncbi:hypothetical protein pb186bvf_018013 [Paramecium bursaria]